MGDRIWQDRGKALEWYARTLRHEPNAKMMVVDSQVSKKAHIVEECIIFTA